MEPPPRLRNLGNTCYMNAALQCVLALAPLHEYFQSTTMESDVQQCGTSTPTERAMASKFVHFVRKIKDRTQLYAPEYLKQTIDACLPVFQGFQQHDAHEFLVLFLEALSNGSSFAVSMFEGDNHDPEAHKAWQQAFAKKYSVIIGVFYGQSMSTLVCIKCGHASNTYEPFSCLGVEIDVTLATTDTIATDVTLATCLQNHFNDETVSYSCEKCQHASHTKKTQILRLPKVLVITLKRFTSFQQKLTQMVTFFDTLAFHGQSYNLYGIIFHHGSCSGGHYTAQVRMNTQWFHCNDEHIEKIDQFSCRDAYILFYRRI